jgi:hypothetical protein
MIQQMLLGTPVADGDGGVVLNTGASRSWTKKSQSRTYSDDDNDDDDDSIELVPLDKADHVLRELTVVTEQATASREVLATFTSAVSLLLSNALVTGLFLQLTDQVFLLLNTAFLIVIVLGAAYTAILYYSTRRPGQYFSADTDEAQRKAFSTVGRWTQNILFMLNFAKQVGLFVVVALLLALLTSLFAPSLPAFNAMLVLVALLEFVLIVAFASHPAVGMLSRSTAFLAARTSASDD